MKKNLFFAHSGGVTSTLNATAASVIASAQRSSCIDRIYVGKSGILGALHENLLDVTDFSTEDLKSLRHTPSSAFGSCRYKLHDPVKNRAEFQQIMDVFHAHNIGYFIYNGGNDSQDTTLKMHQFSRSIDSPLLCIGLPKTIDNDLAGVDCCPGFASAAKYIATSTLEASLDIKAMYSTSTRFFAMEVMGRNAGWLAAASALAQQTSDQGPHLILLPENPFNPEKFLSSVKKCIQQYGHCVTVVSEGISFQDGKRVSQSNQTDAFGHPQLGGVAPYICGIVRNELQVKHHYAVLDYCQRSAGHLLSSVDLEHSDALGKKAISSLENNQSGIMLGVARIQSKPYQWSIIPVPLSTVANHERKLPPEYIHSNGFHVTQAFKDYLEPLIEGEYHPPYMNGLPSYFSLNTQPIPKKRIPIEELS